MRHEETSFDLVSQRSTIGGMRILVKRGSAWRCEWIVLWSGFVELYAGLGKVSYNLYALAYRSRFM